MPFHSKCSDCDLPFLPCLEFAQFLGNLGCVEARREDPGYPRCMLCAVETLNPRREEGVGDFLEDILSPYARFADVFSRCPECRIGEAPRPPADIQTFERLLRDYTVPELRTGILFPGAVWETFDGEIWIKKIYPAWGV